MQHDKVKRRGGYGIVFESAHDPRNVAEELEGPKHTSARAELMAVVRALELANKHEPIKTLYMFSDSSYAVLETNRILHPKDHKVIKGERDNGDLIKRLDKLLMLRKSHVKMEYVKRCSVPPIKEADRLAREASERALAKSQTAANPSETEEEK